MHMHGEAVLLVNSCDCQRQQQGLQHYAITQALLSQQILNTSDTLQGVQDGVLLTC